MKTSDFGAKLAYEIRYFENDFSKIYVHRVILKVKFQLPNLTSNFGTRKHVGDNFFLQIRLYYLLPTKYEENVRTLSTLRPTPAHQVKHFQVFKKACHRLFF